MSISTKYFTETIKYLGIPVDAFRRTYADIEHYAARHSGNGYFGRTGLPELEKDWIEYDRE